MATGSSVSPGTGSATKARLPSRESATRPYVDMFGMIAMFAGAFLALALLVVTYSLDLSMGIF